MTDTATQTALPATGTWVIDPSHSSAEFVAKHLVVAKVRGRFAKFSGTVRVADPVTESTAEVVLETASVDTRDEQRDAHLRSADFFDAEQFPEIAFRSTGVRQVGDDWEVDGQLTIRDVTRPVTLHTEFLGLGVDPWGNDRAFFSAHTRVNREDFGLTWNQPLTGGGVVVGKDVRLEIEVQLVKQ